MKKEIKNMLLAFGICDTQKQAAQFIKNKNEQQLQELYKTMRQRAIYSLLND